MPFFVYILKSEMDGTYYKGSTENYKQRLIDHNNGLSKYTSGKKPWQMIYVEGVLNKKMMLIRERKLKKCKASYFEWLANQPWNLINK